MPVTSQTVVGFCVPLPLSRLGFWLAGASIGIVHAFRMAVSSRAMTLLSLENTFLGGIYHLWLLQCLHPSFKQILEPWGEGCNIYIPFKSENSTVSYSLHADQQRVIIFHCCVQKKHDDQGNLYYIKSLLFVLKVPEGEEPIMKRTVAMISSYSGTEIVGLFLSQTPSPVIHAPCQVTSS